MTTPIYHIPHVNNLESIIKSGRLLSYSTMQKERIQYKNIAHQNIQNRRATTFVPCGSGGKLHHYVPFYFAPRSPMLYAIHKGNVEGYPGQELVAYLVSTAQAVQEAKLPFVFTDGHAIMEITNFFDTLTQLDKIDWHLMKEKYWNDTNQDMDRKRRRQAEFLVHSFLPWELVTEIGVFNLQNITKIEQSLQKSQNVMHKPIVKMRKEWYY
ncbi:MAG: DUF4433 domain-containing protein [Oscillatoria sp. SIO1A7]|nr:DUF4433 domain-containing protein [Oscillatoria sp. SIO1A7]